MSASKLPEGTDSIIEDEIPEEAIDPDDAGGVMGTGSMDVGEPATAAGAGAGEDETPDHSALVEADKREAAAAKDAREAARQTTAGTGSEPPTLADAKTLLNDAKDKVGETASGLKGQAADKAREYALLGKDRASGTLHDVARMLDDAAGTVDEKVGSNFGDYARQASQTVKGFAERIDEQDVDALFEQGRELVRKSPAIAVGAAAAAGFLLMRVVKAGLDASATGGDTDVTSTPAGKAA